MQLTLKNFTKLTALPQLQNAKLLFKKNAVREIDEETKGHFVAYVDEGENSWDVQIILNEKQQVTKHVCDCSEVGFMCSHRVAMLLQISEKGTTVKKPRITKAQQKLDELFADVTLPQLQEWLVEQFAKNKILQLNFEQKFNAKTAEIKPEQIILQTETAVKLVVKSRKKIENTELKAILDAWKNIHTPAVENIVNNLHEPASLKLYNAILLVCHKYKQLFSTPVTKINNHITALNTLIVNALAIIEVEAQWHFVINNMVEQMCEPQENLQHRIQYLNILKEHRNCLKVEHEKYLCTLLVEKMNEKKIKIFAHETETTINIYNWLSSSKCAPDYLHLFKPTVYYDSYNLSLIDGLIANQNYTTAEKYCLEMESRSYSYDSKITYNMLLKNIYTVTNQPSKYINAAKICFESQMNLPDYLLIMSSFPNLEDAKKWRSKQLGIASRNIDSNYLYQEFVFALLHYEKNYIKMMEKLSDQTVLVLYIKYFETFFKTSKIVLLKLILQKKFLKYTDTNGVKMKDADSLEQALELINKNYSTEEIKLTCMEVYSSYWSYYEMPIAKYYKELFKLN